MVIINSNITTPSSEIVTGIVIPTTVIKISGCLISAITTATPNKAVITSIRLIISSSPYNHPRYS